MRAAVVTHRALVGSGALAVVAGTAAATASVPVYRLWIVVTYTVLFGMLVALLVWGRAAAPGRSGIAAALLAAAVATEWFPAFSYLSPGAAASVRHAAAAGAVLAAVALAGPWRRGGDLALGVATATYLGCAVALIRLDPRPRIDVWYILQGAADGLLQGRNMYTDAWPQSPGETDAFTYLPGMGVLLAPGRWLLGDVRWSLVALTAATAWVLPVLARRAARPLDDATAPDPGHRQAAAGLGALLLLLPGTPTQVEQAWTEPLLAACLVAAAVTTTRTGRRWGALAVTAVALGLASKQHLVLLVPLLAAWPRFGPRRALAAVGLAGVAVLPWFVADPGAMWHDTVTLLVHFHVIQFSDTWYLAAVHELGLTPPFWLTGLVTLGAVATATLAVRRRRPGPGQWLRWAALVLFAASLANKQAFYNQYWLVAALVLASWAPGDQDAGSVEAADAAGSAASRPRQTFSNPA